MLTHLTLKDLTLYLLNIVSMLLFTLSSKHHFASVPFHRAVSMAVALSVFELIKLKLTDTDMTHTHIQWWHLYMREI